MNTTLLFSHDQGKQHGRHLIFLVLLFVVGLNDLRSQCSPPVTITTSTTQLCRGSSATLTAGGATSYSWSTTSTATAIVVSPTITTTYTLTGIIPATCTQVVTQNITVLTLPTASTAADQSVGGTKLIGGSPTAAGGTSPYTYLWLPNTNFVSPTNNTSASPSVNPSNPTIYTVKVTDANGCIGYDNIVLGGGSMTTLVYGSLERSINGSYYKVTNGVLGFKYFEEYDDKNHTYEIYDEKRKLRASGALTVFLGNSTHYLVLASSANGFNATDIDRYFTLEVTNNKNETSYLKFKYGQ